MNKTANPLKNSLMSTSRNPRTSPSPLQDLSKQSKKLLYLRSNVGIEIIVLELEPHNYGNLQFNNKEGAYL